MKLTATETGPHLAPVSAATAATTGLGSMATLENEIDAMLTDLTKNAALDLPDEVMRMCSAFMGRCTEIHVQVVRVEGRDRELRWFRTQQLAKVMDLIEFMYRSASRIVEIKRQEVELSK